MASDIQNLNSDTMPFIRELTHFDVLTTLPHSFNNYTTEYPSYLGAPVFDEMGTIGESDAISIAINGSTNSYVKGPVQVVHSPIYNMFNMGTNLNAQKMDKCYSNFRSTVSKEYDSDDSCTSSSSSSSPLNFSKNYLQQTQMDNYSQHKSSPKILHSGNGSFMHWSFPHDNKHIRLAKYEYLDVMERRAHGLMERFKSRLHTFHISQAPPKLFQGCFWDDLSCDIWKIFCDNVQKEETYINKLHLWQMLFLHIRNCFQSYGLFLVGSTMSGFALEGSDIDMCLLTKPVSYDPRTDALQHLTDLKQLLLKSEFACEVSLVMAKVPILKFKDTDTGFEIDLNCNNAVGIRNTHLLYCYARLDWRVRPLVTIIKLWALKNQINDAKNLTISSYSWALMVIHYLQCGTTPAVLPSLHVLAPDKFNSWIDNHSMDVQEEIPILSTYHSANNNSLADLLIGFMRYYSHFDYTRYAISVRTGTSLLIDECRFMKSPKNDPNQWKYLCIEEPFDLSNTAKSVFDLEAFHLIKNVISTSYELLASNKPLAYILPVDMLRPI